MKLYAFDEVTEQLELLPLAARRALDHAGLKLSRAAWSTLPLAARAAIVTCGSAPEVGIDTVRSLATTATPPPDTAPVTADPLPDAPPPDLAAAYGEAIGPAQWAALSPLDRYALVKVANSSRGERVAAAFDEIVRASRALRLFDLRDRPLSVDEVLAAVTHPGAGGVVAFLGAVRDENDGHPVTLLEYEAYPAMVRIEMARIGREIAAEIPGVRLAALHRVGSLAVGDLAIVCAAGAPHRAEAFAACRALIDRIKERAPIWKREHGPEGPYWVGWQDARCSADEHGHSHGGHHHER